MSKIRYIDSFKLTFPQKIEKKQNPYWTDFLF